MTTRTASSGKSGGGLPRRAGSPARRRRVAPDSSRTSRTWPGSTGALRQLTSGLAGPSRRQRSRRAASAPAQPKRRSRKIPPRSARAGSPSMRSRARSQDSWGAPKRGRPASVMDARVYVSASGVVNWIVVVVDRGNGHDLG